MLNTLIISNFFTSRPGTSKSLFATIKHRSHNFTAAVQNKQNLSCAKFFSLENSTHKRLFVESKFSANLPCYPQLPIQIITIRNSNKSRCQIIVQSHFNHFFLPQEAFWAIISRLNQAIWISFFMKNIQQR